MRKFYRTENQETVGEDGTHTLENLQWSGLAQVLSFQTTCSVWLDASPDVNVFFFLLRVLELFLFNSQTVGVLSIC